MKPFPASPPIASTVTPAAASPWAADPAFANQLAQVVTFDKYQLSLPPDLKADPPKKAGAMTIFAWKGEATADLPPPARRWWRS
jgi:hypothetical protein